MIAPPASDIPAVFLMSDSFNTGGSERQFAMLAQSIEPSNFRLSLGCIQKRGSFLNGLEDVTEYPLGGSLYSLRSMQVRIRLARYLAQSRTVIAHAFDFYTNLLLIPAARMARVPVVIGSQRQLGDLLSPAKARVQRMVLSWCDKVLCNSNAAANRLTADGLLPEKISVIGNGLPSSAFAPTPPALSRLPGRLRVGMIARMNTPSKNHATFLRVAGLLAGRFADIEFLLVGDGPLRPELERQAADLGLRDKALFLGDCQDIPSVLASMDVSVSLSRSESLSNAILESMAAGVPVVATRVGGNPELITSDRGKLVNPGDELATAHAIEKILREPEMRRHLGSNAQRFAREHFTASAMAARYEELYRELIERKAPRIRRRFLQGKETTNPRRLKVAIVAASTRYVGGQSAQAKLLLEKWYSDPEVEAYLIPIDPRFPRGLQWAERVPLLRTIVRQPFYLVDLWKGLSHTDIAHIFSASYSSFLIAPLPAMWMAMLKGKKTLLHYHSGEAPEHLRGSWIARSTLAKADRLIVPTGYLTEIFGQFGLNAQSITNVVDLRTFCFRRREPLQPHLLCTRGFHPYYCVEVVVRAFAELQRQIPEATLTLVGGGAREAAIRKLVGELSLQNVSFAGVVSRENIVKFYADADIFINASSVDNMPVSVMEAFACGTPVVSTAPDCMRYLIEHERTGMLSAPGDALALAQNVMRLLRDPVLSDNIAVNAHAEALRFGWSEVRGQWLATYRSLAGESSTSSPDLVRVA